MRNLERPRVEYRTPDDLVHDVRRGLIRIPTFQRRFKWEAVDIVRLFDSVTQGFPIGNLLFWRRPADAQRLHVGPLTVEAPQIDSALWVVDGQQRITSLVGSLTHAHDSPDPRFRVHLDVDEGEFHTVSLRQDPPQSWIPVSLLLDTATLLKWMRDNSHWLTEQNLAMADRAAKAIREYQIPTYVVYSESEDELLEIFTRMNDSGKRLTKSEVFQALHSTASPGEPASLAGLGASSADTGFGSLDERLALRTVLAYRGGDVFRDDFKQEFNADDDVAETFREAAAALKDVVVFLQRTAGIPHIRLLPYSHVIPILVRFVRLHGSPEGRTATLLRRWLWRGAVAGTQARGVSVADIRGQVHAVEASSAIEAAVGLLQFVKSASGFTPDIEKVNLNHTMTKISVLGLMSAEPIDPRTGNVVDIGRLLETGSVLRPVFEADSPLGSTLANRVILPAGTSHTVRKLLINAPPTIAASHLIDAEAQRLLHTGEASRFLARRANACISAISRYVDLMAEWGARDGRSMADILKSVA